MAKLYRLTARAEMRGAIREPGFQFTLEDGEVGPHRAVVASNHGAQIADHLNTAANLVDVPLYEEVKDEERPEVVLTPDDLLAQRDKRIAELENELAVAKSHQTHLEGELAEANARRANLDDQDDGAPKLLDPPIHTIAAPVYDPSKGSAPNAPVVQPAAFEAGLGDAAASENVGEKQD